MNHVLSILESVSCLISIVVGIFAFVAVIAELERLDKHRWAEALFLSFWGAIFVFGCIALFFS